MSLRGFHIFFISFVTLFFTGVAVWTLVLSVEQNSGMRVLGFISVAVAIALPIYGVYFLKKAKKFMSLES